MPFVIINRSLSFECVFFFLHIDHFYFRPSDSSIITNLNSNSSFYFMPSILSPFLYYFLSFSISLKFLSHSNADPSHTKARSSDCSAIYIEICGLSKDFNVFFSINKTMQYIFKPNRQQK